MEGGDLRATALGDGALMLQQVDRTGSKVE